MKTYSEVMRIKNFEDRLEYLYIGDKVGGETFGTNRWLNQQFYKSPPWRDVRDKVILRDAGCDLAFDGCELSRRNIIVHHINPITKEDIIDRKSCLFDMENLIAVSLQSHNYIHYGTKPDVLPMERTPNDTCPWKRR